MMTVLALSSAAAAPLPEDAFLSFTTRSYLVTAGAKLAWLEELRGVTNIIGCTLPSCEPRKLTNYTSEDGGAVIDHLALSEDGATVLYSRGEEAAVNPSSAAAPLVRRSYSLAFASGALPTALAPYSLEAATYDTRGEAAYVTFAIASNGHTTLAEMRATGTTPTQMTPVPRVRTAGVLADICSGTRAAAWAPDGQTLAFAIRRLDHSFIGLWTRGT